jgi:DNA-binding CsgD family transcriptional regulator
MESARVARLTEKQRACLRLVYAHMSSKEIAPKLGIEPGSVDQHIKAAMRILDVGDRRTAAKMLAEHEKYERNPGPAGVRMQEQPIPYEASVPRLEPLLPLPLEGLRPTHVGWLKRLGWIAGIAIGIALAFAALMAAAEVLSRLLSN